MLNINATWCQSFLKKGELALLQTRAENDMEKKSLLLLKVSDLCVAYVRSFYKIKAEKASFDKSNRAQKQLASVKYRRVPFIWIKNERNKLKKKFGKIVTATKQGMQNFRKHYENEDKLPSLPSVHSSSGIQ